MSEFNRKTVRVSGAGRGIGRQIALDFGAEGANLCVNYQHFASEAAEVLETVERQGGRVMH